MATEKFQTAQVQACNIFTTQIAMLAGMLGIGQAAAV
jgi:hypothetical protein